MTVMLAFDADQDVARVIPRARADKIAAAARYLKNLSPGEISSLSAAGIKIISIFETTAERALQGAAAGTADAVAAIIRANAFHQPTGSAIFFTADFDVTVEQQPTALPYFRAAHTGLSPRYKLGVYANGALCQACLDAGIVDYTWLAGGMGMRGSRAFAASGKATMIQDVGDERHEDLGISIDSDVIDAADFGGWVLPTPAAA